LSSSPTALAIIRRLARAVTWTFYRAERHGPALPDGPVLLVANHPNALLDPSVVWATAGRDLRFLAKAPLFRVPVFGALLRAAGAIPVYRAIDAADMSKNAEMFAAVRAALGAGDAVCIFPEGTSHSSGRLEPLRTGAARIALVAAAAGVDIAIVPVALNFDWKAIFRSRASVVFGEAFRVDSGEQVRPLTERIARAMREILVEVDPVVDAAILERVDRLYVSARPEARHIDRVERRRSIAAALARLRSEDPEWYSDIAERMRTYDARLARFGLRDRDLGGPIPAATAVTFAVRETLIGFLLAPFVLAAIVFVVPYWVTDRFARRMSLDEAATTKVFGGAALYAFWIALIGWIAWRSLGPLGAAVFLAFLPALAVASLMAIERETAVLAAVRGYLAVTAASPSARVRLERKRNEIANVLDEVQQWLLRSEAQGRR
jgi:glycerol-3-phosphate O-acyltransferase / dihydroxyacetone phosphate acyltransferase